LGLGFIPAPEKKLQDFSTHYAETLQSLETKINKNRQQNRNFVQFLTGDDCGCGDASELVPLRRSRARELSARKQARQMYPIRESA
jgi:hypothetical protein